MVLGVIFFFFCVALGVIFFLCGAGCEPRAWCTPGCTLCSSCFPGCVGRDGSSSLPSQGHSGLDTGKVRHLAGALRPNLSKGNQTFGWQGHCFHICSFRRLCYYSTYCDLGCPLPSAKALSQAWPTSGDHRAVVVVGGLFLPLLRLGQAAGRMFLLRPPAQVGGGVGKHAV